MKRRTGSKPTIADRKRDGSAMAQYSELCTVAMDDAEPVDGAKKKSMLAAQSQFTG